MRQEPSTSQVQRTRHLRGTDAPFRMIGMGASAGGFRSLCAVLEPLPVDLTCPIVVVQHLSPLSKSILAELLARKTELGVAKAVHLERMKAGHVYVGPPDLHLAFQDGRIRLLQTPELHHHRPSIDLMFESMAAVYGPAVVAVILSGSGNDGSRGIISVHNAGGVVLCEDPDKAEFKAMPAAAVSTGCVDMVLELGKIAGVIAELCSS